MEILEVIPRYDSILEYGILKFDLPLIFGAKSENTCLVIPQKLVDISNREELEACVLHELGHRKMEI